MSGGDADKIEDARERIQAALVGMIMIMVVLALIWTLENLVFQRRVGLGLSVPVTLPGLIESSNSSSSNSSSIFSKELMPILISSMLIGYSTSSLDSRNNFLFLGYFLLFYAVVCGVIIGLSVNFSTALICVVLILLTGFRIIIDYFVSLAPLHTALRKKNIADPQITGLYMLPPFSTEILWLPLPGYERCLAALIKSAPQEGLQVLEELRQYYMPGIRKNLERSIRLIVPDQLGQVQSIRNIILTANNNHAVLSVVLPDVYAELALQHKKDLLEPLSFDRDLDPQKEPLNYFGLRFINLARQLQGTSRLEPAFIKLEGLKKAQVSAQTLRNQLAQHPDIPFHKAWLVAAERWLELITAEIEQIDSVVSQTVIQPFQYGVPLNVSRAHLFKGREEFTAQIAQYIVEQATNALVLYGPRRCGKTSFLLNLPRLLPHSITSVYIDISGQGFTSSSYAWCFGMAQAIATALKLEDSFKPSTASFSKENPYESLYIWLDSIRAPRGEQHLLVCLDEIEHLGKAVDEGRLPEQLLGEIRHMIQHMPGLTFLFCGARKLDELGSHWTNYFINARPMKMTYLQTSEARALLTEPDPAFHLQYTEVILEKILYLTRSHPYLVQLIGHELVMQVNKQHTHQVTEELCELAIEEAMTAGEIYFNELWSNTVGETPHERELVQDILWAIAHQQSLTVEIAARLKKKLYNQLRRHHLILLHEDKYEIEVPFIQLWIQQRALY